MFRCIHLFLYILCTSSTYSQKLRYVRRDVNHLNLDEFQYYNEQCSRVCQKAGGYRSGGPCECKCHGDKVFETTLMKCVKFKTAHRYLLSSSKTKENRKITKVSSNQLKDGVTLNYCDASNCKSGLNSCQIKEAMMDEMRWKNILEKEKMSDIVVTNSGILKFQSETSMFNGKLLKLDISCDNNSTNGEEKQLSGELLIEVAGMFEVPNEIVTASPTTTTTSSSTTTFKTSPTTVVTTSSSKPEKSTKTQSAGKSRTPMFATSTNSSNDTVNENETFQANNGTVVIVQKNFDYDSNRLLIILLPIAFASLLILCILVTVCCRKRSNKKRRRALSEPVSLFQPTTPIFLVQKRGEYPVTNIKDPLYNFPSDPKRGTVKHLYAQIGKKLKKSKKQLSIDGSLDDGYITDDSDYYKRFSAFPADLYSFPGSTISLNEPDYRIPEDVNYLSSPLSKIPPYSSYRGTMKNRYSEAKNSNDLRILGEFYNCPEARFTSFKSENESSVSDEEHPYDEVGGVLRSNDYKKPSIEVFYDDISHIKEVNEKPSRPIRKKNATKRKCIHPIRFCGISNDSYDVVNAGK